MLFLWQYGMSTEKRIRRCGPQKRTALSRRDRRDDFLASVIKKLRERVANRCCKPDCRVLTIGPGDDPDSSASIGKAAHIAAAAPGGPRYDASMTREQRRSFDNGIWLCSNHAAEVDADRAAHPPELLREWKVVAERRARQERGRRLPEPDDARTELVAALTGVGPKVTLGAITNVHAAVNQVLEGLDPRFAIRTAFHGDTTSVSLHARESVPFQVHVPGAIANEWRSGLLQVIDHGLEATLPAQGLQVTGSPVFAVLDSVALTKVTISPHGKPAVQKLRLLDERSGTRESFDDVHGSISGGRKSATFAGIACGGLLSITWSIKADTVPVSSSFGLSFDFGLWEGRDVRLLPHFDKVHKFVKRAHAGDLLEVELEVDGLHIGRGRSARLETNTLGAAAGILEYVAALRVIASHVDSPITFACEMVVTSDAFENALVVAQRFSGQRAFAAEDLNDDAITFDIEVRGDNIAQLLGTGTTDVPIVFVDHGSELEVPDRPIPLPRCRTDVVNFRPELAASQREASSFRDGDRVPIKLIPREGFRVTERYLGPNETDLPDDLFAATRAAGTDAN